MNPSRPQHENGSLEPYRELHGRLFSPATDHPVRTVLFTASQLGEGCSTVAGNLAIYLSQIKPNRVLLLELDVLHPARKPIVPAPRDEGLSDVLAGRIKLEDAIHQVPESQLYVLSGGNVREGRAAPLSDKAIGDLMPRLKAEFTYVLADGPAVNGIPPIFPLVRHFDGVVLVTEANRTRRQVAAHSIERLKSASGNLLGVVMNQRRFFIPGWIYGRL